MSTLYHSASAFHCYALYASEGVSAFLLGTGISSLFAAVGLWCVLFATSDGRISRRSGADKRTSGFPFKNSEAEKRKGGKKQR